MAGVSAALLAPFSCFLSSGGGGFIASLLHCVRPFVGMSVQVLAYLSGIVSIPLSHYAWKGTYLCQQRQQTRHSLQSIV